MSAPDAPWRGGPVTDRATCVLQDNPGPLTLDGTNTWVLAEPGARDAVVVDPGQDGPSTGAHRDAVLAHLAGRGLRCALVVLTHHHADHTGALPALLAACPGAEVVGRADVADGEEREVGGLLLRFLRTPGHTADSLSVLVPADRALLSGDVVLGRGSTVVGPDGDLGDHLRSLGRLATEPDAEVLLPGHGPARRDGRAVVREQLDHRLQRLEQVRAAVDAGAGTVAAVVLAVHGPLPEPLARAARWSVEAQLRHLDLRLPA
ncbi:MBL fold metallo-hydrolase [Kineococcus sp. SYSU DK004]|uniref:MBL fold metallo-hydrolase n=1 Tax=Kineococcus sp. SYSU DK004 TaxID=3383125 RepID=UPI003D7D82BB